MKRDGHEPPKTSVGQRRAVALMIARLRTWRGEWAVWALIALYIAFFGTLTVQKQNAFQTTAFDLGNVDQAVWNTRHGRLFAMTNIEGLTNRLGTHVEPILLPISLLYFIWSDPRALLLLQTFVIALGAWPVYLLAQQAASSKRQAADNIQHPLPNTRSRSTSILALTLSAAYLLFPALQSANLFDFHAVSLAPTFFLWAFYHLERGEWSRYALFALLTMSCKEEMPLLVAMLGLYALLVCRRRWVGLITILVAAVWFWLAVGWLMPRFDTQGVSPLAGRYTHLGDSLPEMAVTLLTRPGVVLEQLQRAEAGAYVRDLLAPTAFLSLLAPQVLALALPTLAVNLLSSDGFMHQLEGFHYGVTLVPVVVVAAAYGAEWLIRRLPGIRSLPLLLAAAILVATLVYHRTHGYTPLAAGFAGSWPQVTDHHRLGEEMAGRIPSGASLAALPYLNPHASQRRQLFTLDRVEEGLLAPLHQADYLWLDVTHSWPLHPNDLKAAVEKLLAGDYGVEQATDGWLLLRRGAPGKTLPDSFYDFARAPDPQPQYPMHLQFLLDGEPALECLGFDLHCSLRPAGCALTFYWRALHPLPSGLRLYPFYMDDATGQILEDTGLRPLVATLWYPPQRWREGEIVRTDTLPWDVGPTFSVGLGVVQGDDWGQVGRRLPIRVESSDLVVRLFDGDTWARLLHVEGGKRVEEWRTFTPPSPQHPLDADFGGQIHLLGYDLACTATTCDLRLYWQAQKRLETSYTVFVHLLGPAGNLRAQADSVPRGGGYPTVWWLPGEVVADSLTLQLPPDTPGDLPDRLIVGLYDPVSGERLPVIGTGADAVELTRLP